MDLAPLQVTRGGGGAAQRRYRSVWGALEFHADGSGRLQVTRSTTDQMAEGMVLYLRAEVMDALRANALR